MWIVPVAPLHLPILCLPQWGIPHSGGASKPPALLPNWLSCPLPLQLCAPPSYDKGYGWRLEALEVLFLRWCRGHCQHCGACMSIS